MQMARATRSIGSVKAEGDVIEPPQAWRVASASSGEGGQTHGLFRQLFIESMPLDREGEVAGGMKKLGIHADALTAPWSRSSPDVHAIDYSQDLMCLRNVNPNKLIRLERSATGHQLLPLTEDLFHKSEDTVNAIPSLRSVGTADSAEGQHLFNLRPDRKEEDPTSFSGQGDKRKDVKASVASVA